MKGAATAALGEMAVLFGFLEFSLGDRNEGVKLGESTFKERLEGLAKASTRWPHTARSTRPLGRLTVRGGWLVHLVVEHAPCKFQLTG